MKNKITLNSVTLVTVSSVFIEDTVDALKYNLRGLNFPSVKFVTHEKPKNLPSNIEYCHCDKISSSKEYSRFMLYELDSYIDTPHCLVIQRDGVVINPHKWNDDFLNYDYIGAPWPVDNAFLDSHGRYIRVGNGGFSLRSKKLLGIPNKLSIPFREEGTIHHEDTFICVTNRDLFEKEGIKFADIDIAKYFSHEIAVPEIKNIKPFGFHKYRKQNRFYPQFPSKLKKFTRKFFNS